MTDNNAVAAVPVEKKKEEKIKKVEPPKVESQPSLRKFLFAYFDKSFKEINDFPAKDQLYSEIEKRYPRSVFNQKRDNHFSYYKSLYRSLVLK